VAGKGLTLMNTVANTVERPVQRQQMKPGDLVFIWPDWPDEYATRIGVVRDVYTVNARLMLMEYDECGKRRNSPRFLRVDAFGLLWRDTNNYVVIPRPNVRYPDEPPPEQRASLREIPAIKPGDIAFRCSSTSGLTSVGVVRRVYGEVASVSWLRYDESGQRRYRPEFHSCEASSCLLLDREDYAVIPRPNVPYVDEECEEED